MSRAMIQPMVSEVCDVGLSFYIGEIVRGLEVDVRPQPAKIVMPDARGDIALVLSQPYIGQDDDLGRELLRHMIDNFSIAQVPERRLILTHRAVILACITACPTCSDSLYGFLKRGGSILVCELSARRLGLSDRIKIGRLTGVDELCRTLLSSQKVINL